VNQACRPPTDGESGLLRADLSREVNESNARWSFIFLKCDLMLCFLTII
jgi:hypothetical protein